MSRRARARGDKRDRWAVRLVPASQVAAAVAKERDRCASIADSQHFGGDFDDEPMWTTCAARIASAIRAGDAKEGKG